MFLVVSWASPLSVIGQAIGDFDASIWFVNVNLLVFVSPGLTDRNGPRLNCCCNLLRDFLSAWQVRLLRHLGWCSNFQLHLLIRASESPHPTRVGPIDIERSNTLAVYAYLIPFVVRNFVGVETMRSASLCPGCEFGCGCPQP